MDFIQRLDPSKLVLTETVLSFALSLFTAPPYNLPIFLFGLYLQESTEAIRSQQAFTYFLGASVLFDVVWMARHEQNAIVKLFTIILMVLKVPTFFAMVGAVREWHGHFGGFSRLDSVGATVWSMPGGFTSSEREGYQPVDEERPQGANNIKSPSPVVHAPAPQPAPGAYQV
ncbi:hypothetical protein JOM56_006068 [Amanita muscaria]